MDRGTGDRAVSEVVGFILIFGMLVTAFTVYQGIVVPDQNRQVEFQHNQEVQGQMQDLRNAIIRTAATGSGEAVSLRLGANYPRRTIAMNLGVSSGQLSTRDIGGSGVTIDNVRALDSETRDYIDSDANGPLGPYSSKAIQYSPHYTFYTGAPETRIENTIAYNQFDTANLSLTDQVFVNDRRITLLVLNGSLSQARQGTVSVSTEAISTSSKRIGIENTTGERVNVTIPTTLPVAKWEDILADEMGTNGYVVAVSDVPGSSAVRITLEQGETYELSIAKVGVGESTTEEEATYLVDIEGDDVSVVEGGSQKLVVEVRDRFSNPISDVAVTSNSPIEGSVSPSDETTGTDGRASFVYSAPADVDTSSDVEVSVKFGDGSESGETVTFDIRVLDSDGSGGGGAGGGQLAVSSVTAVNNGGGPERQSVRFDIQNNLGQQISIEEVEVALTSASGGATPVRLVEFGGNPPWNYEISIQPDSGGSDGELDSVYDLGTTESLNSPAVIPNGGDATVYLTEFYDSGLNAVDMRGAELSVTFHLANGEDETVSVSIPS